MSSNENILENMSRDYLEIELDAIKNENMIKTKEIEDYKLEINKLRHRVAKSKSVEGYFISEIESLKSIHDAKIEELMKKISIHEEQIRLLHEKHTETINYYENELTKKETDNDYMNEIKKNANKISVKDNLIDEFKSKINGLSKKLIEHEFNNNILKKENTDLTKELLKLNEQLQEKNFQLDEKDDLISQLQNEVSQVRREINILKIIPANSG